MEGPDRVGAAEAASLFSQGRLAEAEACARLAAAEHAEGYAILGVILRAQGDLLGAVAAYDDALARDPGLGGVHTNKANALNDLQRWEEAGKCAAYAVVSDPADVAAWNAGGVAAINRGLGLEAVTAFSKALDLRPTFLPARMNLANALAHQGDMAGAVTAYDAVLGAAPDHAPGHAGRGHALTALGRYAEAAEAYDRAYRLAPDLPYLAGHRLHAKMRICDWRGFEGDVADLKRRIDAGGRAITPFAALALPLGAARERQVARAFVGDRFRLAPRPPLPKPGPRLRIGYFSADFQQHATAHLLAEVLERHDRDAVEVTAFSFGPDDGGTMRKRVQAAVDRFVDVRAMSDDEVCALAQGLPIDIAVDLKGHTLDARPALFAQGLAPIQVSFLGYPATVGDGLADYIVADPVLIRPDETARFAESVAWLPRCYQPNDVARADVPSLTSKIDHRLPTGAFVFASFNGAYKLTPDRFGLWLRLLKAHPTAVLWLLDDGPAAADNLRRDAQAHGVDASRLIFAPRVKQSRHLERLRHADLFLDTAPCSAHTTAADALLMGLPILTQIGDTFAGRVAASLLTDLGLTELITEGDEAYLETASDLATRPEALEALRGRLSAARRASRLFDMAGYTRDLERLFRRMHQRAVNGLAPDDLPPEPSH